MTSTVAVPRAADWPQWRGPARDGFVPGFEEPASWPDSLTQQWTADVGLGYATPLLVGGHLYVFSRQGDQEVMTAFDAATGAVRWRSGYSASVSLNERSGSFRHGEGPKSTPAYADGRLFSLGMGGIVTAFDAETGQQLWSTPAPPVLPLYGSATSPLIDGRMVIIHVGGHDRGALTAFDVESGEVRWSWPEDGPSYASPVVVELEGTRQIVGMSQTSVIGVAVATGELLWRRPFLAPNTTNSVTPVIYGRTILVSGQSMGVTAFSVTREGGAWGTETLWENSDVSVYMGNGVVIDDVFFAISHRNSGQFFALDARSGTLRWRTPGRDAANAAIVRAGRLLFLLKDDGRLVVARENRNGLVIVQEYRVSDGSTWAQPVVDGRRVFIKDESTVASWTWE